MGEYKTPGVYIKEKNAFGNSIVEAETAIPVFIGLTKKALDGTESLLEKPVRISSMTEYEKYFGEPNVHEFTVFMDKNAEKDAISVKMGNNNENLLQAKLKGNLCTLYYHLVMFFANGGSTCYVVSVGNYSNGNIDKDKITNTILPALKKVQDITLLVIPEAAQMTEGYADFYKAMLSHCAANNRFAILDVPKDVEIDDFRTNIGSNFLAYGAAYYPWLETTVLSDNDITEDVMRVEKNLDLDAIVDKTGLKEGETHPLVKYVNEAFTELDTLPDEQSKAAKRKEIHNALLQNLPAYKLLAKKIKDYLNLLPPSATMAGIYTMVDHSRGVWKAPANVSVSRADKPSKNITDNEQADLNMPMNGKAINALRAFPGEGIKVWGARTLDGNSQDWRYINVRRTMSFLEISVKNAARAYVFEPNDANTWINMKCMIENFLRSVWKRGGLAGSTPEEAYEVHVGLGDTMTADDILEGILRITVLVAVSRPAEFIEITFQQQMQKS